MGDRPTVPSGAPGREPVAKLIATYACRDLFGPASSFIIEDNPYKRPSRPQDIPYIDFTIPITKEQITNNTTLLCHRLLCNIYETDLLYLPEAFPSSIRGDFESFYSDENKLSGELIRPVLEHQLFDFLAQEIDVSGGWSTAAMVAYFQEALARANQGESSVGAAILEARTPEMAAKQFLVQLAADFLTEASAMARNLLGNFGPVQSELFKILIDEYGYGVHSEKHSTLYQETLKSCGLDWRPHAYWQFFLGSSLALVNYFHWVSRNHALFFRYVGALLYTEATLSYANAQHSRVLRQALGPAVDTRYFDEHVHIDRHHGRMVLEKIIGLLVERYGTMIIPELVRGFEEFRLLQSLADADLIAQIRFTDGLDDYKVEGTRRAADPQLWQHGAPLAFVEARDELSVPHVHDADEVLRVVDGALEFVAGHERLVVLRPGEAILIPAGRLHGSRVLSESCRYEVSGSLGATA